jgi:hypothetical protein
MILVHRIHSNLEQKLKKSKWQKRLAWVTQSKPTRKKLVKERESIQNMQQHPVTRLVKDTKDKENKWLV